MLLRNILSPPPLSSLYSVRDGFFVTVLPYLTQAAVSDFDGINDSGDH
jgi:hypothetical protein